MSALGDKISKNLEKMQTSYKKDVISKEGIKHFLEETETGRPIGTEFYDADITSPIEALRHIIQKNYTPNITSEFAKLSLKKSLIP